MRTSATSAKTSANFMADVSAEITSAKTSATPIGGAVGGRSSAVCNLATYPPNVRHAHVPTSACPATPGADEGRVHGKEDSSCR